MGYQVGHYYNNSTGACTPLVMYFPTGSDYIRNGITNAYRSLFGRYAEPGGISFHISKWSTGNWSSFTAMVANTSMSEAGAYSGLSSGGCPPPIVYGCTDSRATNYNSSATNNSGCIYAKPSISLTTSKTQIVRPGETVADVTFRLTWSISSTTPVSGRTLLKDGSSIQPLYSNSGSVDLSPSSSAARGPVKYSVGATNLGGYRVSGSVTVTFYDKPEITLTLEPDTILQGNTSKLTWSITGDATTLNIQPGIGDTNIESFVNVTPSETTTYTAVASHPIAGSGNAEIELTVLPQPSVEITGPEDVDYGDDVTVDYDCENIPESFVVTPYYYSLDGDETVGDPIELPVGDDVEGEFTDTPPWNDRGPAQISYVAYAEGYGSQTDTDNITIDVDIDQRPDTLSIPESDDKFRDEQPVITPDDEVGTIQLLVDDIDIPVEIKADSPILVEIDNSGNYQDVRQI
ncbi:Rhs family protein-like protein [Synechococcus phage S-CAM3]|uniref:Rhs family protein-like protein n=1 Tax=Synechococcus phage S-CAM3 TaxID=1883366 RepID=A0A1D8KIQ0_9CAUD|nr:Rhs family protein-like protein [Synechococcus phage S-CAM3]